LSFWWSPQKKNCLFLAFHKSSFDGIRNADGIWYLHYHYIHQINLYLTSVSKLQRAFLVGSLPATQDRFSRCETLYDIYLRLQAADYTHEFSHMLLCDVSCTMYNARWRNQLISTKHSTYFCWSDARNGCCLHLEVGRRVRDSLVG
jgi:hypothetical protein